jgi:hypothetical protein
MIIIVINNEMRNTDKDDRPGYLAREAMRTGDRSIAQVISREKLCAPAIVRSPSLA